MTSLHLSSTAFSMPNHGSKDNKMHLLRAGHEAVPCSSVVGRNASLNLPRKVASPDTTSLLTKTRIPSFLLSIKSAQLKGSRLSCDFPSIHSFLGSTLPRIRPLLDPASPDRWLPCGLPPLPRGLHQQHKVVQVQIKIKGTDTSDLVTFVLLASPLR